MQVSSYIRGAFAVGSLGPFRGVYVPSCDRITPYFEWGVARLIARSYLALPRLDGEPARQAVYDRVADAFRFTDCVCGEWLVWFGTRICGVTLYPIGSPEWTWELVGVRV